MCSMAFLFGNIIINLMIVCDFFGIASGWERLSGLAARLDLEPMHLLLIFNAGLIAAYVLLRREYVYPARLILAQAQQLTPQTSLRHTAREFSHLIHAALTLARDHETLRRQLGGAQQHIEQLLRQQHRLQCGAVGETGHVFRTIHLYAQYLEDMILAKRADADMRYDYDEVCEAAANLQCLMGGMQALLEYESRGHLFLSRCDVGDVLGRFLVQLTPALERRSMRITSHRFPASLAVCTDEPLLRHALWALLYACLRYAEADSTLHIEGKDEVDEVALRFFVTHSNPAAISLGEREAYLSALTNSDHSVHMFAHVIGQHPNMQLAGRIAAALGGTVDCLPQGPYCCMLEWRLPSGPR